MSVKSRRRVTSRENMKNKEYSQRYIMYGRDRAPKGREHTTSSRLSLSSKVFSATASRFAFLVLSPKHIL